MTMPWNLEELKSSIVTREIKNIDQKILKHVFLNLMNDVGFVKLILVDIFIIYCKNFINFWSNFVQFLIYLFAGLLKHPVPLF